MAAAANAKAPAPQAPPPPPPIDLSKPRFDQSTFFGRLRHFMDVTDFRTLFTTDEELDRAKRLLKAYENGDRSIPEEELWKAKKIRDAILHPDTGEKVPLPFRVSAFAPSNIILTLGLLTPNPSIGTTIFWQWINQSYNIALNHANRNASNQMSNTQILQAYSGAVLTSCLVAVGLGQFVKRSDRWPKAAKYIRMFVPYTAVASAGAVNVFLMRRNEMTEGIAVKDSDGQVRGKSRVAGQKAIGQVAISRAVIPLPILLLPPLAMAQLERIPAVKRNPRLAWSMQFGLIVAVLFAALPPAIALFPQQLELPVASLEEEFRGLKDRNGKPIATLYCNRGL